MAKGKGLLGKIGSWLRGKKPIPSKIRKYEAGRQEDLAHGGIAAGSIARRDALEAAGLPMFTEEETAKWHLLGKDEVEDFIYNSIPLFVNSSNVGMAQYFLEDQKMMVEYLSGGKYLYSNVTEDEAYKFATYPSKGTWCWDYLRVRGSKTAHRKPYIKL